MRAAAAEVGPEDLDEPWLRQVGQHPPEEYRVDAASRASVIRGEFMIFDLRRRGHGTSVAEIDDCRHVEGSSTSCTVLIAQPAPWQDRSNVMAVVDIDAGHTHVSALHSGEMGDGDLH
jgi:hypothetical protein